MEKITFENLKLIPSILKALREENYKEPTSIQAKSIPIILNREDVLGSAQTGTGKTAAFAIPIIQHLSNDQRNSRDKQKILSLVITPTRELAIQIGESFTTYGKYTNVKNTVIFGGVPQRAQTSILKRGIDISSGKVEVSLDGAQINNVYGDLGEGITPGVNKKLAWRL